MALNFQELVFNLQKFWSDYGCIIQQPYDIEKGASTMNPATFLRSLGPEPWHTAMIEPCRRPTDARYGENPNRLGHYYQFQVILKPSPDNAQFTYFQQVGGVEVKPVALELTYGLERIAMYLQNKESVYDIMWNDTLKYGEIFLQNEIEQSKYNFEVSDAKALFTAFDLYQKEVDNCINAKLVLPAYDYVLKCSHTFNLLDARGVISKDERINFINRVRTMASAVARLYVEQRKEMGFPLCK